MGRAKLAWLIGGALIVVLAALNVYQLQLRSKEPVARLLPQQIADLYHRVFYQHKLWVPSMWLGVDAQQNPNDAWITQEILFEVKPDLMIETGTAAGGSAALWATILEQVNPDAEIVTIDIQNRSARARDVPVVKRHVEFLVGSSTSPRIVSEVKRRAEGKRVLVLLDSDHSQKHVARELELYAPLVSVGSYLIVQDTNVNGHPVYEAHGPGPWEAVDEFLKHDHRFERDSSRERFLFTMHPRGYLKRVR